MAHSYWRIRVGTIPVGTACTIAEVQFRATKGGADQATGGTAIAGGTDFGSAASAFDNNGGTFWGTTTGANCWVGYQFAAPVDVLEVALSSRQDGFGPQQTPKSFFVDHSDDGSSWTEAWEVYTPGWNAGQTKAFPADEPVPNQAGRYWRVVVTDTADGSFAAMNELQLRGSVGGADLATDPNRAWSPQVFSALNTGNFAFDGLDATHWVGSSGLPKHLGYEFTSGQTIVEVAITSRNDSFGGAQAPSDFVIQSSPDGETWTTVWSVAGSTGWGNNETRVFTNPSAGPTARPRFYAQIID